MGGMTIRLGTSTPPTTMEEKRPPTALDLAASPEGCVGLLPARAWQSGFCHDTPDLLPLRVGDAPEWGTDVGLVDPAQDGQRLLHPVVPVEKWLSVGRLHHGVGPAGHPAGSLEVATVHGLEHLHVQIGYDATVPGEDAVSADAQRRQQRLAEAREQRDLLVQRPQLAPVPLVDADVVGPLFDGDDVVYLVADPNQAVGRDVQSRGYRVDEHYDR